MFSFCSYPIHIFSPFFSLILTISASWPHGLGNDREAVGDAIYGTKIGALVAIKDKFSTPRAVVSLRFFNCFRLLLEKAEDPDESLLPKIFTVAVRYCKDLEIVFGRRV